jgi:hypothetical protein
VARTTPALFLTVAVHFYTGGSQVLPGMRQGNGTACAVLTLWVDSAEADVSCCGLVLRCAVQEPPCQPPSIPVQAVLQPLTAGTDQQQQQQGYCVTAAAGEDATPAWQVPGAWAQVGCALLTPGGGGG